MSPVNAGSKDALSVPLVKLDALVDPPVIVAVEMPVTNPFAFTVTIGTFVDDPYVPTSLFTVANVVALDPALVVTSPVSAGNCESILADVMNKSHPVPL